MLERRPIAPAQGGEFGHALRWILMDEDVTTLPRPSTNGVLLEAGVLDLHGDHPVVIPAMPRPNLHQSLS